jgi:HSP20 family protein
MLSLYRPLEGLFRDDFWNRGFGTMGTGLARRMEAWTPTVDVVEQEGAYLIKAELPGIKPEEIDVNVTNNVLTLQGQRKEEKEEEEQGYRHMERMVGTFRRSFTLPQGTKLDEIEASAEDGVLTVKIPKVAVEAPKKVSVKSGSILDKAKRVVVEGLKGPQPRA